MALRPALADGLLFREANLCSLYRSVRESVDGVAAPVGAGDLQAVMIGAAGFEPAFLRAPNAAL